MGLKEQWDEEPSIHRDRIDVTGFNEFYAALVRLTIRALVDNGYTIVETAAYQRLTRIAGGQETFFPPGEESIEPAEGHEVSMKFVRLLDDFSIPNIVTSLSPGTSTRLFIGPWTYATKGAPKPLGFIQFGVWVDEEEDAWRQERRITNVDEAMANETRAREITQLFAALSQRNLLGPKTFTFPKP